MATAALILSFSRQAGEGTEEPFNLLGRALRYFGDTP
jgi:hypothetical protein